MQDEYSLDEEGNKKVITRESLGLEEGIELYAATKYDIDAVKEIITSAENAWTYSEAEIKNIIDEETGAFFEGQKTVNEVADIIQKRVQVYLNENR